MANKNVIAFTDKTLGNNVAESEAPVLVDFWADWCAPCHHMAPVIEELADTYADRAVIGKLDVDENQKSMMRLGIMGIPTLILYKGGAIFRQWVGVTPKQEIASAIDEALAA